MQRDLFVNSFEVNKTSFKISPPNNIYQFAKVGNNVFECLIWGYEQTMLKV